MQEKDKNCLLMFSGGYDTLLCVPKLISLGFKNIYLVTFDNGTEKGLENSIKNAERMRKIYGERIIFVGIKSIIAIWRKFLFKYFLGEKDWSKIDLLPTEIMCLTCRASMYIKGIIECKERDINYLAEGARKSQKYPEQHPYTVDKFKGLCKDFSIELILPVWEIESKGRIKEELLTSGIMPKTAEPFCTLAMPLL